MLKWLETYARTHLFYIILIVGGVFAFRFWLSEHDARVAAINTIKQQEVLVADLKAQITTTQAQAAQKVQVVNKVVHDATTPSQVVASLPALTQIPLVPREIPGNTVDVEVKAQPLIQLAGEAKEAQIELQACKDVGELKDKQLTAKDTEITALKKKPRWYVRVKHAAEAVGVGVAIGFVLAVKK